MTEIENRNIIFKSYKLYSKALEAEVKCLQQFLTQERIEAGYRAFKKEAEEK